MLFTEKRWSLQAIDNLLKLSKIPNYC